MEEGDFSEYYWHPNNYFLKKSRIARFMARHNIKEGDWRTLVKRSMDRDWFWPALLEDAGVEWFKPYHTLYDGSAGMPWGKWFLGGKINITHNCLDRHVRAGKGERTALIFEHNNGDIKKLSYKELFALVNTTANALRASGVRRGNVVGMALPVCPESVALMFACFKIGAICMQMAPRISASEMAEHMNVAGAKILFMVPSYTRGEKMYDMAEKRRFIYAHVPDLRHTVIVDHFRAQSSVPEYMYHQKAAPFDRFLKRATGLKEEERNDTETRPLDAEAKALILFSSGTTGTPKRIVHTHGGALSKIVSEVGYAFDCHENDVFYWVTDFGWMMAPWAIIGSLFYGATVLLYDGDPFYPDYERLPHMIERHRVSVFGFTPGGMAILRDLSKKYFHYEDYDTSSLRILGSTGSVLDERTWHWYFKVFGKKKCPIINISGGTEVIGSMNSPLPIMPLKPGTVGTAALGMNIAIYDENDAPVEDSKTGNLVCVSPFPSMTRGFYKDTDRYLATYYPHGEGDVWHHPDRIIRDHDGYYFMQGRTDDVIIRNGVKFDPQKIASAVISFPGHPSISDAAAIGIPDEKVGERIIVFAACKKEDLTDEKKKELREYVKREYDPMAGPDEIFAISVIPRNSAAKIPLKDVRAAFLRKTVRDGVVNPEAFEEIRALGERYT